MTTGLLIVDVQPAFHPYCGFIARRVAQRINNTRKPVVVMWVGDGLSNDDEAAVREYLRENGARPGRLAQCTFVEKGYSYFRPWMDQGVRSELIVTVGKAMLKQPRCTSSDCLNVDVSAIFDGDQPEDPIHLPQFDSKGMLELSAFETCGGGNRECLAEIELWLDMHSKPYTRLDHLIYG